MNNSVMQKLLDDVGEVPTVDELQSAIKELYVMQAQGGVVSVFTLRTLNVTLSSAVILPDSPLYGNARAHFCNGLLVGLKIAADRAKVKETRK